MKRSMKQCAASRSGQVLVIFLTTMTIALLLVTTVMSYQSRIYGQAKREEVSQSAAYLAEAGLELGYARFKADSAYTGETITLGNGTVVITVTNGIINNQRFINAAGTVNDITRRYRIKMTTQEGGVAIAFRYALQAGDEGISLGNNAVITGNVYSNQNIIGRNGSIIDGEAAAVGTISGVTVTGTQRTGQPVEPMPEFDQAFWLGRAQAGGTITGDYHPTDNSTIGPIYIDGNLMFDNNITVTIAGPIYVSGTITLTNGVILQVDNGLGRDGAMLISTNPIAFGNSLTVENNDLGGYLLIISLSGSETAITIGNTAGSINAPLYAPNGTIDIGNSSQAVAFTGRRVIVGNNASITYSHGLANASFTTGPGGSWTLERGNFQEY